MDDSKLISRLESLNNIYFNFTEVPKIKWSKGKKKKKYKSITFGSYDYKENIIKIHPILGENFIPNYVLDFVIYHELLHYEDRKILSSRYSKTRIHNLTFHKREKKFLLYKEAQSILNSLVKGEFHKFI